MASARWLVGTAQAYRGVSLLQPLLASADIESQVALALADPAMAIGARLPRGSSPDLARSERESLGGLSRERRLSSRRTSVVPTGTCRGEVVGCAVGNQECRSCPHWAHGDDCKLAALGSGRASIGGSGGRNVDGLDRNESEHEHGETDEARAFYLHLIPELEESPTDRLHLVLLMKDAVRTLHPGS